MVDICVPIVRNTVSELLPRRVSNVPMNMYSL